MCVLTAYASQLDALLTKKIEMMTKLKGISSPSHCLPASFVYFFNARLLFIYQVFVCI